jgi:hypothetical protein
MNTKIIAILLVVVAVWGGWALYEYWQSVKESKESDEVTQRAERKVTIEDLGGALPGNLEQEYEQAKREGAAGLRRFLEKNKNNRALKDPRKAWIQLDYLILLSMTNPGEAKAIYADVKSRVNPGSAVYERVKRLQHTYE